MTTPAITVRGRRRQHICRGRHAHVTATPRVATPDVHVLERHVTRPPRDAVEGCCRAGVAADVAVADVGSRAADVGVRAAPGVS